MEKAEHPVKVGRNTPSPPPDIMPQAGQHGSRLAGQGTGG